MSRLRKRELADLERLVGRRLRRAAADERDDLDTVAIREQVLGMADHRHHDFVDLDGDAAPVVAQLAQEFGNRDGVRQ